MYEVTLDIGQLLYYAAAAVVTYYALQFSSILLPTGGKQIKVDAALAEPPTPETYAAVKAVGWTAALLPTITCGTSATHRMPHTCGEARARSVAVRSGGGQSPPREGTISKTPASARPHPRDRCPTSFPAAVGNRCQRDWQFADAFAKCHPETGCFSRKK